MVFLAFALVSCDRKEAPIHDMFRWPRTGHADFDSAHVHVNQVFYVSSPLEVKKRACATLDSIGGNINELLVNDIMIYWKLRLMRESETEIALGDSVAKYMAYFDERSRPYPYHKMKVLSSLFQEDPSKSFMLLNTEVKWFEEQEDFISVGICYNNLGVILSRCGYNKEKIMEYYQKSDTAYTKAGADIYKFKNGLNIAFHSDNDSLKESYHRIAVNNSRLKEDVDFYQGLLRNLYLFTDSVKYIDENIETLKDYPGFHNELALNYAYKGRALLRENRIDESLHYLLKAKNEIDTFAPSDFHVDINRILSDIYRADGQYDRALKCRDRRDYWQEKVNSENAKARVYNADAAYKIASIENEWKLHAQKMEFITWIVSVILGLAIVMTAILIYKHIRKKERQANIIREELSQSRSSLAANTIILREKNKILNEVKDEVGKLNERGKISEEVVSDLTKNLKMHFSNESERESFLAIYDKLNFKFFNRLKEDYPSLTESQLRLAGYIAMGMSNHHIAQMLNIGRDSLKVNRSRLRKKLGLHTGESLEHFLRTYSCGCNDDPEA